MRTGSKETPKGKREEEQVEVTEPFFRFGSRGEIKYPLLGGNDRDTHNHHSIADVFVSGMVRAGDEEGNEVKFD